MSIGATNAVNESPRQRTSAARLTMYGLADHAAADGDRCFPGITAIRTWTRLPSSTQYENLDHLEDDGWIVRHKRGLGRGNHYVLVLEHLKPPTLDWHCAMCRHVAVWLHQLRQAGFDEAEVRRLAAKVDMPEVPTLDDVDGEVDEWFPEVPDRSQLTLETTPETGPPTVDGTTPEIGPLRDSDQSGGPESTGPKLGVEYSGGPDPNRQYPSETHQFLPAAAGEHEHPTSTHQEIVAALEAHCLAADDGAVGAAAKQLRAAGATPAEVATRAGRLRDRWGRAAVTAPSLARWWRSLAGDPAGPKLPDRQRLAIAHAVSAARVGTAWDDVVADLEAGGHAGDAIAAARAAFDDATNQGAA